MPAQNTDINPKYADAIALWETHGGTPALLMEVLKPVQNATGTIDCLVGFRNGRFVANQNVGSGTGAGSTGTTRY